MDSLIKPADLFEKVKEIGQPAVAVTDHGTLFSAWDCWKASKKTGVKLLMGCEFNFVDDLSENQVPRHVILIAKNHQGYKNLLNINKIAYDNLLAGTKKVIPRIDWNTLEDNSDGVICTTACSGGILGQLINTRRSKEAFAQAERLKSIFGESLFFEIQPHAMVRKATNYNDYEDQRLVNNVLIDFAEKLGVRVVPTTDAHYLTPEEWKTHDTLLAMGQGLPARMKSRLKYSTNDFFVKSREEVLNFLRRYYKDKAEEFCDNTLIAAEMCETPKWIDPRSWTGKDWELPSFPVQDQEDYQEFRNWLADHPQFMGKPEDVNYLRFWSFRSLEKIGKADDQAYIDRVEKELDTFEYRDLSSYMLIVADYITWAKNNECLVGPGRGCLEGKTPVLTSKGFKKLKDVKAGDFVYTHDGTVKEVFNTHTYDVKNETLLKITSSNSFGEIILTKDHLVFAGKTTQEHVEKRSLAGNFMKYDRRVKPKNTSWIPAEELSEGDYIYFSFPQRTLNKEKQKINLIDALGVTDKELTQKVYIKNKFSSRDISRNINASYSFINSVKNGLKKNDKNETLFKNISGYLKKNNSSLQEWLGLDNYEIRSIPKEIEIDKNFAYLLGRWTGDGCFHGKKKGRGITISFNKENKKDIEKVDNILGSLGFKGTHCPSKASKGFNLTVTNNVIFRLFSYLFKDYKGSSSKHLPIGFRSWGDDELKHLIYGLIDSDGHIAKGGKVRITTTSKRLSLEVKEALAYIKIPSIIYINKNVKRYNKKTKNSFVISFYLKPVNKEGYFSKIRKIDEVKGSKVYDISVDENNSYLTTNGVVHNSAGGSLVGYLTGIHEADSIKYDLIFERFYSKIKKGISDIDTDFGQSSKPKVQQYLIKKYGKDMVAHVSNLSTMTPKVYVKDICRTFEYGGNRSAAAEVGQRIADSIPASMKTIDQALDEAPLFAEYAAQEKYSELKRFKDISGSIRNLSTHAGGIIIASRPIHELVPTRRDKDYNYAIEYDKDRAEDNSLVKMDILGLSTLDVIDNTIKIIKSRGKEPPPSWTYDDPKTYELITSGNTKGVFQLGTSQNTMTICQKMRPKNLEDLAMINSMARPGFPRAVIDDFIKDKETGNIANLIHPILKEALGPTFGYALFDEVLLKLAEAVAGWDLAEADRLRKFVKEKGKNPKKDKKLRADFIEGGINNKNLSEEEATQIWDEVVAKLGSYIFNKSHAICYSMIGYQTAYLKAHYPLEFMVANLIHEDGTNAQTRDKNIQEYKKELRDSGIKILPPDLNKSQEVYSILDDGKILTGFSSLKSIGKDAIPEILEKRPFNSFDDFLTKIDNSKVRINSVYALASAGCLDGFGLTRRQICLYAADYRKKLQTWQERRPDEEFVYPWPDDVAEWSVAEMFAQETYYLGEGLCCGIKEAYPGFFNNWALNFSKVPEIFPESESYGNQKFFIPANVGVVQAVIKDLFTFTVKKETSKIFGQTMAKIDLEDPWGNIIPMTLFPSSLERFLERLRTLSRGKIDLEVGIAVHCAASINWYEGEPSLIFEDLRQVAPTPPRPKDLKPRKVTMKITKKKAEKRKKKKVNRQKFLLDIEAELIEEGHSDIEYE